MKVPALVLAAGLMGLAESGACEPADGEYPLLEFALDRQQLRDSADAGFGGYYAAQLARVRHEMARAKPPADERCAGSIGAGRFADLHVNLGDALQGLGQYEAALAGYHSALACRPRDVRIHEKIAAVRFVTRDFEAARAAIDQALRIDPRSVELHRLAGNCDFATERWVEAMSRFRYVASSDPDPESASFAQLMFWLSQRRAGSPQPEWVARRLGDHWPRALILYAKGEYSEAELLQALRQASDDDPWTMDGQLLSSLFFAGESWWARGEPDVARRYFAAAVNLRLAHTDEYQLALAEIAKLNQP